MDDYARAAPPAGHPPLATRSARKEPQPQDLQLVTVSTWVEAHVREPAKIYTGLGYTSAGCFMREWM